ncbi:MAG: hypothetical protein ABSD74_04640 [Rhizomicrobium sp.]
MKYIHSTNGRAVKLLGAIAAAGLASACLATAAQAADTWSTTIAKTAVPHAGCFHASYPSTEWKQVACQPAPSILFLPSNGLGSQTVGNGHDYAIEVSGTLISSALGSFPKVKVKTETGEGQANNYSLQLNSNFMSGSPACDGASNPSNCLAWLQFIYSSGEHAVFMQYWLINYDATCPAGWNSDGGDCYKNSSAVAAPLQVIKQLKYLSLSGTAVSGGLDTVVLTTKTDAYTTTGEDTVTYLSGYWTASEFNIVGDGGGSQAVFNAGTKITDQIDVTDGLTTAPTCESNAGTTGETNNLNLGACTAAGGATPSISFLESLAK